MSKYRTIDVWNEFYGRKESVYDYAGRLMKKSACGDPNSAYHPTLNLVLIFLNMKSKQSFAPSFRRQLHSLKQKKAIASLKNGRQRKRQRRTPRRNPPKQKTCAAFSDTGIHKVIHHNLNETVLDKWLLVGYGFLFIYSYVVCKKQRIRTHPQLGISSDYLCLV